MGGGFRRVRSIVSKLPTINRYQFREIGNKAIRPRYADEAAPVAARRRGEQGSVGPGGTQGHGDQGLRDPQRGDQRLGDRGEDRAENGRARRVLVVEDEALICVETADTLERQGFEVHLALSGEDALRRLRNGLPVDILFTDVNLAGPMDGATLARLAREIHPRLLVAYTSGTVDAVAHPVAGSTFVAKPYNPERIGRLLTEMVAVDA